MQGYCAPPDTIINEHVWSYEEKRGFFNCTDNDLSHHASPVLPFLKAMAVQYPDYNFCGVVHASPCQQAFHILSEGRHRDCLINQINSVKDKGTFGGVLLMYGIIEGQFKPSVDLLEPEINKLVAFIRLQVNDNNLPIILGRYEENGNAIELKDWFKYKKNLMCIINSMPNKINRLVLTPYQPVAANEYCDNHHYSTEGYRIWSEDAVKIIKENNLDSWNLK